MSGRESTRSENYEKQWILFEFRHYLPLVIFGWPFDLLKDITGSFRQRKCVASRLSLSLLPLISKYVLMGGCYGSVTVSRVTMSGVFLIVGAALFMSPPQVGCGCPTRSLHFTSLHLFNQASTIFPQFLGFTFINLRISNQVTIFTLPSREASHLEHLHKGLALFLRGTLKRLL